MKTVIVIFGGTGDLAQRYLIPALHSLHSKKKLDGVEIVGLGRRYDSEEEYLDALEKSTKRMDKDFRKKLHYCRLHFQNEDDYGKLAKRLESIGKKRIFYLATLPGFFTRITDDLNNFGLLNKDSRIVYEKPFGQDFRSARELNRHIQKYISEDQVFRTDHYLDKELVGNIGVVRFTNLLLEPIWNSDFIDHIQIIGMENLGIGDRGKFYDGTGVVKDFVQSHALQLLALTTMDEPEKWSPECIRDEKVKVLKKVRLDRYILGQYKGYTQEKGVNDDSRTPTFAALKFSIKNKRWKGVPIYMMTGKALDKKLTRIYVEFKNTSCRLFDGVCPLTPNSMTISIYPDNGIYFTINTKVPGEFSTTPSTIEFCHSCQHGESPSAYENVFAEALRDNRVLFVRHDEVEEQWRIADQVKHKEPFQYEQGSFPREAVDFIKRDNRFWHIQ